MMNRALQIAFITLLTSVAGWGQAGPKSFTGTWTNTDAAFGPVCPATSPKQCLGSIVLSDITSVTPVVLMGNIASNATTVTYTYTTTPAWGNHTYAITATGYDSNGVLVTATPATTVVDIEPKLNAPQGWTVTVTY